MEHTPRDLYKTSCFAATFTHIFQRSADVSWTQVSITLFRLSSIIARLKSLLFVMMAPTNTTYSA